MRLLTKTTLYFLAALLPLLMAAGWFLYLQFSRELDERTDKELITEEIQWIRYLKREADNGTTFALRTDEIYITPVNTPVTAYPQFETKTGINAEDNRRLPFRHLAHVVDIRGVPYLISLRRSQEQRAVLVANITRNMLLVFLALLVITITINYFISRYVWKPFQQSLEKIRKTELQQLGNTHFGTANIKEFKELNDSLNHMTQKMYTDYVNMKEFTENAAHEMQTPVAIVQSKLELLLQDENLKAVQAEALMQANDALSRLSKLNQSLLLLSKIENHQYEATETISIKAVVEKYIRLFEEQASHKQLKVTLDFTSDWMISMHPLLADSIISNLLGNAIKYNYPGGEINLNVQNGSFLIENTSDVPAIDRERIFQRFLKSSSGSQISTGLGLAIVKKIADVNRLNIVYQAAENKHRFILTGKN